MPVPILMPALSPTMTEGTLARWLKKEGDAVLPGDVVAEVETDKATMEVEAIDEGTLRRILVNEGSEGIPVNTPIAILSADGEGEEEIEAFAAKSGAESGANGKTASAPAATKEPAPAPVSPEEPVPAPVAAAESAPASAEPASTRAVPVPADDGRIVASPLARRMAKQAGIDLAGIRGSGSRNRIVKADIDSVLSTGGTNLIGVNAAPEKVLLSNVRKVIAERLLEAKQTIPHFYLETDCDAAALLELRKRINDSISDEDRITVNDIVVKAVAMALRRVPQVNVAWGGNHIVQHHAVHVAVAVAVEDGLFTPVIRNTDRKGFVEIAREMRVLAAKARGGKLVPEEYQGGTFSVSNLGMFDTKAFSAIINPPQAGILAVGAAAERSVVRDGEVVACPVMTCTLSGDHRVVDGAIGARWLAAFKGFIEDPATMLA